MYICIDLKSFYASVECLERGLDPLTTKLVVADPELLPGICAIFVFIIAAVFVIIKVQTADMIALGAIVGIMQTEGTESCNKLCPIRGGNNMLPFVAKLCTLGLLKQHGRFLLSVPSSVGQTEVPKISLQEPQQR